MATKKRARAEKFEYHPVTPKRWQDMAELFGPRGACAGCWCMYWRTSRSSFDRNQGAGNKRAMKRLIDSGRVPGILGYAGGKPVAWCSVEPRDRFPYFERTRLFKPIDERPVWSVTCLFIGKEHRGRGMSGRMIRAAVEYVKKKGGEIVEGYPIVPKKDQVPEAFAWNGIASAYLKNGFVEVARPSEGRSIVRCYITKRR
jgi:GNAT superfamily N-acetyltransferase